MYKRVFLALIALLLAPHGPAFAGVFDAPEPPDAFVMEPASGVPDGIKQMAGKWTGTLVGAQIQNQHTIIVERMDPRQVWMVWSIGTGRGQMAGGPSAWFRLPGLPTDNSIIAYVNGAVATYTLKSESEISVVSERGGFKMKGTLTRVPMPVTPYKAENVATYWPPELKRLEPAENTSTLKVPFPESAVVEPPSPGLPPEKAKWLGKWVGWACHQRSCDTKLAVLNATAESANIIHILASDKAANASPVAMKAFFVGDELAVRYGGLRLYYRMRPSGVVEMYRTTSSGAWAGGVLTKQAD